MTTITFHGGAGTVTGSNFLIDFSPSTSLGATSTKVLVDCGLRQGREEDEAGNYAPFAYDPSGISHLIVTHAHIDHIGRIPKLVKDGFRGTILSTPATKALALPMLRDAVELLEQDARHAGREPLYAAHDIDMAFGLWTTAPYHEKVELPDQVSLTLLDSGHILGSAMACFERAGKKLVFTGDLGGGNSPLLGAAEDVRDVQYLVIESVYGDRTRPEDKGRREELENAIEDAAVRGGTLLIPAFSTERTQDLLFEIRNLMVERRVPHMPVFVDSPLAQKITEVFVQEIGRGDIFHFEGLEFVEGVEESAHIAGKPNPKIVLAGSGMGSGGRIRSHFGHVLPDPKSTVLIVGYQAAGTLGRRLIEGETSLRVGRDTLPVRAHVQAIYGYSAHRDGQGLLDFVNNTKDSLEQVFVVMGEPAAASFLAQRVRDYLGTKATTPEAGESATINF